MGFLFMIVVGAILGWLTSIVFMIEAPRGILSSAAETLHATESGEPRRLRFDPWRVLRSDYFIDDLQPTYFVIESFADLYHQTVERDFDRLYRSLNPGFTYANAAVIDVDDVLHRGTQEYHLRGGRGSNAEPV